MIILILAYLAAAVVFTEPRLYVPLTGLLPMAWWTGVVGKGLVIAAMVVVIGRRLKATDRDWRFAGWGKWEPLRELGFAAGCAGAVWFISFFLLADNANLGGISNHAQDDLKSSSGWWLAFISSCVLTGIREELVYRGGVRAYLSVEGAGSAKTEFRFVLVSGVLFAAMHWLSSASAYLVYALIGAVFAATFLRSGSLRAVMLAHILVNTAHLCGLGNFVRYKLGLP